MTVTDAITAFVALFVVIDPIGLTPVFIALTTGTAARPRRVIALRACLVSLLLLTVFGLAGEAVLEFLGISLPAFRIAGGILLFLTALDMLFDRRKQRREGQADSTPEADDPSVFPLAMPLIAAPGAIATMILLAGSATTPGEIVLIHAIMLMVLACVLALFLLAGGLEKLLGAVGINVVTRLLGMLLAALSVQFVIDGLRALQVV